MKDQAIAPGLVGVPVEYLKQLVVESVISRAVGRHNLHPATISDFARRVLDGEVELRGHEVRFTDADADHLIELLRNSPAATHLFNTGRGNEAEARGPVRHPALDARDEVPGTPGYAKLDPLKKLQIANRIAAHDLEVKKRQQAAKKTA